GDAARDKRQGSGGERRANGGLPTPAPPLLVQPDPDGPPPKGRAAPFPFSECSPAAPREVGTGRALTLPPTGRAARPRSGGAFGHRSPPCARPCSGGLVRRLYAASPDGTLNDTAY